ncbi:MAG: hypothetical protein KDE55_23655 [Novosphingobium sp.]|nr:hypothetical protein [Novosphingobium sp.]
MDHDRDRRSGLKGDRRPSLEGPDSPLRKKGWSGLSVLLIVALWMVFSIAAGLTISWFVDGHPLHGPVKLRSDVSPVVVVDPTEQAAEAERVRKSLDDAIRQADAISREAERMAGDARKSADEAMQEASRYSEAN